MWVFGTRDESQNHSSHILVSLLLQMARAGAVPTSEAWTEHFHRQRESPQLFLSGVISGGELRNFMIGFGEDGMDLKNVNLDEVRMKARHFMLTTATVRIPCPEDTTSILKSADGAQELSRSSVDDPNRGDEHTPLGRMKVVRVLKTPKKVNFELICCMVCVCAG